MSSVIRDKIKLHSMPAAQSRRGRGLRIEEMTSLGKSWGREGRNSFGKKRPGFLCTIVKQIDFKYTKDDDVLHNVRPVKL